jgi:hypothetical protein
MKASLTIASLLLTFSASAFAGGTATKQALQVDFNRMIEDNNAHQAEIRNDINAKAQALDEEQQAEKQKVINFVDVEVGWGEAPPVVDRRYDSVGEARIYKMSEASENQGS